MEDSNIPLQTMGIDINLRENDSYTDIDVKDDKTLTLTLTLTLTTETLPLADEKCLDILSKNQDSIIPELVAYFKQEGIPSQGGRGGKYVLQRGRAIHLKFRWSVNM